MPPQPGEILLQQANRWLYFSQPQQIITVSKIHEVLPALRELEESAARRNLYAAGFISYEAAPAFDPAFQVHSSPDDFPLLWFGLYPAPQPVRLPRPRRMPPLAWQADSSLEEYQARFDHIKNAIAAGYTYQVNLTLRLSANAPAAQPVETFAWNFFLTLAQRQNGYGAYLNLESHFLLSASPELFFEKRGTKIFSRPMKGTARRGLNQTEDQQTAETLRRDPKNRAENVMIVDMLRNDLGRIAQIGSVQVPALFSLEKYPSVWQMTSTVQAQTQAGIAQIFQALFPCASITGAPKVSAMRLIARQENSPRRAYTGSIGFFSPSGEAQFNVAIRTVLAEKKSGRLEYGAGGGLVWDSQAESEYAEALLKAQVLQQEYPAFSLLETLRWTPQSDFWLLSEHLERMRSSAAYFGFPFDEEKARARLERLCAGAETPLRVRLRLARTGIFRAESQPLLPVSSPWRAGICPWPVEARNVFLYHKTTFRRIYRQAERACRPCQTALLVNTQGFLTEFTLGNLVLELRGKKFTPPLTCGLLPGIFRQRLLQNGEIEEHPLTLEDLRTCSNLFLVNSVRGWVPVTLPAA